MHGCVVIRDIEVNLTTVRLFSYPSLLFYGPAASFDARSIPAEVLGGFSPPVLLEPVPELTKPEPLLRHLFFLASTKQYAAMSRLCAFLLYCT